MSNMHPVTNRPTPLSTWARGVQAAVLVALSLAQSTLAEETIAEPYSARYSVYRNGKLQARTEFLMEQQGENWILKSESIGTHGMARFTKFRDYEFVEGFFDGPQFHPLRYVHDLKWIGPDQKTSAEFDWDNNEVVVSHKGDQMTLELVEGAVDPMSLQLELRRLLAEPGQELEFMLVEDDEIELQRFRALPEELLETSLGCLETIPVEKIRRSSKRFTRSWHARELAQIPVRMEHGKTDGDHMELRINELVIDGVAVPPQPGCAARQAGEQRD